MEHRELLRGFAELNDSLQRNPEFITAKEVDAIPDRVVDFIMNLILDLQIARGEME